MDGGASIKKLANIRYKLKPSRSKSQIIYGCSSDEAKALNDGLPVSTHGSKAERYARQRLNAIQMRNIAWELTFKQWLDIWNESGHFAERGRGKGYCMTRIGDTGPYAPNNVEIKTVGENFSESYFKHPWHERFKHRYKSGSGESNQADI
jgi:hypothetical protein